VQARARLPSASLLLPRRAGRTIARRDHQLRIGNLISTRSLSSGSTVEDDDSAACPYFKFPIRLTGHKLNHGQHAAIVGLSYLKEVLDISRDWEDKETKGQP